MALKICLLLGYTLSPFCVEAAAAVLQHSYAVFPLHNTKIVIFQYYATQSTIFFKVAGSKYYSVWAET
jgi:hypothetical protein